MNNIIIDNKIFKPFDEMYYVSEYGEVYSTYCNRILKPSIGTNGYFRVDIHGRHFTIHKLVYLTWVGDIPEGLQNIDEGFYQISAPFNKNKVIDVLNGKKTDSI